MLYPLAQALLYVFSLGLALVLLCYIFRANIAHFIGKTRKKINAVKREITQEYHRGMEEEGKK